MNLENSVLNDLHAPLQYLQTISPTEIRYFKKKPKKQNLLIDTEAINQERSAYDGIDDNQVRLDPMSTKSEGNAHHANVDISQMRMALGSEQLVREQSARTISQQSLPSPTYNFSCPLLLIWIFKYQRFGSIEL